MAQRGALDGVRRIAIAEESGGVRGTPGTWRNPSNYQGLSVALTEGEIPNERQLNSRKETFASFAGERGGTVAFQAMLSENTFGDLGPVFKAALGGERAASSLAINAGGTNNATGGAFSSGTPDPIIKVEYNTGAPDILPVKTVSGGAFVYAIKSAIASRTVTAYKNASQCAGGCFFEDPAADLITHALELDNGAEPDAIAYSVQGAIVEDLSLAFDVGARTGLSVGFRVADWTDADTVSNTADPAEPSDLFAGWTADLALQSLSTPDFFVALPLVSLSGVQFAPEWIDQRAAKGRTSSGATPGSAITGYKQGVHFAEPIGIGIDIQARARLASRRTGEKFTAFLRLFSGVPGAVGTRCVAVWFPELVLTSTPSETVVNGVIGQTLSLKVQESSGLTASLKTKCAVAFFNS